MALIVDEASNLKHFCKICKKGFGCGRALGGHMRAHGIGDENGQLDDEDPASDWEDKLGDNLNVNKRMYALRTNPNRLKSCRVCENCGKEFLSWKSFLEHGKCSSDDTESFISSPGSDGDVDGIQRRGCGWSKRKRSLRAKVHCPSTEEEDLANCLMMLSNGEVDPVAEPEESCASASKNPMYFNNNNNNNKAPVDKAKGICNNKGGVVGGGIFECKACKKVFNSHQALGGHRASHKKVKGCFAARLDQGLYVEDVITHEEELFPIKSQFDDHHSTLHTPSSTSKRKSKVHECSICHRVFSSGQALGGHKRCHWITSNSPDHPDSSSFPSKFHHFQDHNFINNSHTLDLNLPASSDHHNNPTFEVSTEIYLKTWIGTVESKEKDIITHHNQIHEDNQDNTNNNNIPISNLQHQPHSKLKLAKLSELKDINVNGNSSPWLQVGIGSTTDVPADS